jgi:hypothetical protein
LKKLRDQLAQSICALMGGRDSKHLKDISGAGTTGDQLAILEYTDQIIELRLKA